jgi:hypothetical protein
MTEIGEWLASTIDGGINHLCRRADAKNQNRRDEGKAFGMHVVCSSVSNAFDSILPTS